MVEKQRCRPYLKPQNALYVRQRWIRFYEVQFSTRKAKQEPPVWWYERRCSIQCSRQSYRIHCSHQWQNGRQLVLHPKSGSNLEVSIEEDKINMYEELFKFTLNLCLFSCLFIYVGCEANDSQRSERNLYTNQEDDTGSFNLWDVGGKPYANLTDPGKYQACSKKSLREVNQCKYMKCKSLYDSYAHLLCFGVCVDSYSTYFPDTRRRQLGLVSTRCC